MGEGSRKTIVFKFVTLTPWKVFRILFRPDPWPRLVADDRTQNGAKGKKDSDPRPQEVTTPAAENMV